MRRIFARKNIKSQVRLQTILTALVALIVVCSVSAAAFWCYQTFRSILVDRVAASRNDVLAQVSTKVDSLQGNMISMSRLYSSMVADSTYDQIQAFFEGESLSNMTIGEVMDAYQDAADVEYSVTILDGDGFFYASPGSGSQSGEEQIRKSMWYLNIPSELAEGKVYWTQVHEDETLGEGFYYSVARKTKNREGREVTVLLSIPQQYLYDTYENVISGNTMYIVDPDGRVISSNNQHLISLNYFNMERLDGLVSSGTYTIVEKSGVKYLLSRYNNPRYGLVYLEEIPLHTLLSSLNYISKWAVLVAAVAILVSCVSCWVIIRTLTSSLQVLCQKLEQVSGGNFQTSFDVESWAEISLINDSCAEMEARIADLFANLKEEERQKRLAEIEFLQAQINPHFMYNTLFEIKCLVNLGDNEDAERMLENFIAMLRTVLSQKDELITLQEELVILQQYFTVMQCKYGDGIRMVYDIPEPLLRRKVLKFVLQPIMENSIFHGLEPAGSRGTIRVKVWEQEEKLYIQVKDDGVGMEERQLEQICQWAKRPGQSAKENAVDGTVGINNVIRRIKLHFGPEYGVSIASQRHIGTSVLLILPGEPGQEREKAGEWHEHYEGDGGG